MSLVGQVLFALLSFGMFLAVAISIVGWWNRQQPGVFWFAIGAGIYYWNQR